MPARKSNKKATKKKKAKRVATRRVPRKKAKKPKGRKDAEKAPEPKPKPEPEPERELTRKEKVLRLLDGQLRLEEEAVGLYNGLLVNFRNPDILKGLTTIRDQELGHVEEVKGIIESLK